MAHTVLWRGLRWRLSIKLASSDNRLPDTILDRFEAGVQLVGIVTKDRTAGRGGSDLQWLPLPPLQIGKLPDIAAV